MTINYFSLEWLGCEIIIAYSYGYHQLLQLPEVTFNYQQSPVTFSYLSYQQLSYIGYQKLHIPAVTSS